MIYLNKKPAYF